MNQLNLKPSLLAGFMAITLSTSVLAFQPGFDDEGPMHNPAITDHESGSRAGPERFFKVLQLLDLSGQQQAAIESIKNANQPTAQSLREHMKNLHEQMPGLLDAEPLNHQAIKNLARQIAEVKADSMILGVTVKQQILAELTDAQKAKLAQMKQVFADKERQPKRPGRAR